MSGASPVRSNAVVGKNARDNASYNGSYYCITVNNPVLHSQVDDLTHYGNVLDARCGLKAAIWSYEQGESGTKHIQGYLQLEKKCKWSALKNKLRPIGVWCTPAYGTTQENIEYIAHTGAHADKPGLLDGPFYFNELKTVRAGQGSRTDIDSMCTAIKTGANIKKLALEHTNTMLKYFNNAQKLVQLLSNKTRDFMTELYIYTGVAGSGKSHAAYHEAKQYLIDHEYDEEPYYLMVPANKNNPVWFQDYVDQKCVIIDDFYGSIDIDFFKRLIDKYPCTVNVKNGHAQFFAHRVYVTSNTGWRNWWGPELLANKENEAAIVRRIHQERVFTEKYDELRCDESLDNARQATPELPFTSIYNDDGQLEPNLDFLDL